MYNKGTKEMKSKNGKPRAGHESDKSIPLNKAKSSKYLFFMPCLNGEQIY